ncbi:metal-sensitive transcriptional regulator [Herbiconiux sp. CPCC 205716]|uniref:Metal-sensitive transcriptional regulator n=2 Tax=Herbiconiux gentiana TaxID=2970912 RepID=A0ABT2GHU1_9MICO|nr:metal-sensitive transcriptional regulator [Herbiconiux gentiana]MCS5715794.1 metal-sensitive transcriptional regulator [Herbiconiux gentiana]
MTMSPDATPAPAVDTTTAGEGDGGGGRAHAHHGYIADKTAYLKRLKRIEGQARGLQNMVDDEKYCIDILTQISAMTSALESVALGLLNDHLNHCVVEAVAEGGPVAEQKLKEATDAIARLVRS